MRVFDLSEAHLGDEEADQLLRFFADGDFYPPVLRLHKNSLTTPRNS